MAARSALDEMDDKGEFKRKDSTYRDFVKKGSKFEPAAGRYHLYIAYACPWASRCLATRNLKGLQDAIGLSVVHSTWQKTKPGQDDHAGWTFAAEGDAPFKSVEGFGQFDTEGCIPDTVNGAKNVRELYDKVNDTSGKYTVPILWDKEHGTIVNNESADIMRMFNSEFNDFATRPELDLYPADLTKKIDELGMLAAEGADGQLRPLKTGGQLPRRAQVNSWVYPGLNNGVYRSGFATQQGAYEEAFRDVFETLDKMEDILSKQRYLAGNKLTEADVRAFMTLIRFDEVYVVYFKCNRNLIREMPNVKNYVREIYQLPGIKDSVNMKHIKMHYYTSHPKLNHYAVIPKGLEGTGREWYGEPHDRDRLPADK